MTTTGEAGPPRASEPLWKTLTIINEWVRFADTKAAAILAADGVLGAAGIVAMKDHWAYLRTHGLLFGLASACLIALAVSALCALRCIKPRTPPGTRPSLLYFLRIAEFTGWNTYLGAARALADEDRLAEELAHQVWSNAGVAREKHRWIGRAVLALGASLFGALLLGLWIAAFH